MRAFDESGAFCPVAAGDGLRRKAIRGAGATVLSQTLMFAVQMVATIVLARLLAPSDFGVVTMVTTFSLLLMNCGLNGFTEAVIQRDQINHALMSNLFWINAGVGLFLTVGFASAGRLLGRFYGDARIPHIAAALSLTILFTSLSVQHLALLKRAMRFSVVSGNDVCARTVSVGVSILLGCAGWGYWALVAGAIAPSLTACIGAWYWCRWLPGLPRRGLGTRSMVWFAICTYGRFTVSYFTWNLDNLLVGWYLGPVVLGYYKKAYDLFVLPTNQLSAPLTSVAVSALSRLRRNTEQFSRNYLNALSILALLGMGIGADLMLVGQDIIRVLLGPKWGEAGRIFTYFCPGIGVMLLYFTHGWLHLSLGKANRWFRWGMVEFAVTALLLYQGLRWGAVGIALAWVAAFWILTLPALWYAGKPVHLAIGSFISPVWRYIVASALAGIASAMLIRATLGFGASASAGAAFGRIVYVSVLFTTLYVGAVIALHRGCAPFYQILALMREMLPLAKPPSSGAALDSIRADPALTPTTVPPMGE